MAYNRRGYNPDALPAHAEPEQAAQAIGRNSSVRDEGVPSRTDSYATRPPPPTPLQTARQDDRYARSSGSYQSPRTEGGYDKFHDRRQPTGPRSNSYGSYEEGKPRQGSYGSESRRYESSHQGGYGGTPPAQQQGGYGTSPPSQQQGGYGFPHQQGARPPATPAPPRGGNDRDALWPMFRAVDKDRTGQLSEQELGAALVNGDYTSFDPHTVRMMIRMFDVDRSGTISFDEFCGLWGFLAEWRKLFDRFDEDRSGNISLDEFSNALLAFGYRLSHDYVSLLFNSYDIRGRGVLSFDLFVQSCISLKRMTDVFKRYDSDRDGYITLSFEEFLTVVLAQK